MPLYQIFTKFTLLSTFAIAFCLSLPARADKTVKVAVDQPENQKQPIQKDLLVTLSADKSKLKFGEVLTLERHFEKYNR